MTAFPELGVDVDALLVANSVEVQNGLAYAMGAAWSRCWPPPGQSYPYVRPLPLVIVLRVPWGDTNVQHSFRVSFRDADGKDLLPPAEGSFKAGRQPDLTDGASQVVVLSLTPPLTFPQPGLYYVSVEVNDVEKKRIQLEAIEDPNKPPQPKQR